MGLDRYERCGRRLQSGLVWGLVCKRAVSFV